MQPAGDALQRAREQAHANLRNQMTERVHNSLQGLQGMHSNFLRLPSQPVRVAPPSLPQGTYTGNYAALGLRASNPQEAAQLWESRHPAAMSGGAPVPDWVRQQQVKQIQAHIPGGAHPRLGVGDSSQFFNPGGPMQPLSPPSQHPGPFLVNGLVHLGQGLFLHPETGEIHGFGPSAGTAPVAPPAPFRAV